MSKSEPDVMAIPNPFADAGAYLAHAWALGQRDGREGIDGGPADEALMAFSVREHESACRAQSDRCAELQGEIERARREETRLAAAATAVQCALLSTYGRQSVPWSAWATTTCVFGLAVLAGVAEFPLALYTLAESIGNVKHQLMTWVQQYSLWALAAMLCLVGFSLKLLSDTLDERASRGWFETFLAVGTVGLAAVSIYGVANLREVIGQQSAAVLRGLPLAEQRASAVAVAEWTMFTLKWVTVTLPCFGSACIVAGLHQLRDFRKHNAALRAVEAAERGAVDLAVQRTVLEHQLRTANAELDQVCGRDPVAADVRKRGAGAYRHGLLTGSAQRTKDLAGKGARERAAVIVMSQLRQPMERAR